MAIAYLKKKEKSHFNSKRKGRGNASGKGGECGRGHKGQRSRSGFSQQAGFEGGQTPLYRRLPKKRGFNNIFKTENDIVNLADLEKLTGETEIKEELLIAKGLISGKLPYKILGYGKLTAKLTVYADAFSKSAKEAIEKSGGVCHINTTETN